MEPPRTTKKKIIYWAFQGKINYLCYTQQVNSNVQGLLKKTEIILNDLAVTFYVLYNHFFYTQLAFVFDLKKDFHCVCDNIDAIFLFLLQKIFDTFSRLFLTFCFFSSSEGFWYLYSAFFWSLSSFSDSIQWTFFIYRKKYRNKFY